MKLKISFEKDKNIYSVIIILGSSDSRKNKWLILPFIFILKVLVLIIVVVLV